MDRRELLKLITAATGMSMIGGSAFAYGQVPLQQPANGFSEAEVAKLDEIAETILPATETPGAKEAGVGLFMAQFVTDCYSPEDQAIFRAGLAEIDTRAGGDFMTLDAAARTKLLAELDAEAKAAIASAMPSGAVPGTQPGGQASNDAPPPAGSGRVGTDGQSAGKVAPHPFTMIKQMTLFGFFTSKVGATKALRYVAVPGRYDGELAYEPGTPAWAT